MFYYRQVFGKSLHPNIFVMIFVKIYDLTFSSFRNPVESNPGITEF